MPVKAQPQVSESAHLDANQNYSIIAVQGTLGTADIQGTAPTVALGANPLTGALYTEVLAGGGGGGGTYVNISTGTLNSGTFVQTDGTQIVNTVASDAGQNAEIVTGGRKETTFTTTAIGTFVSTDVSNYRSVSVHIQTQGTNSTVNFWQSNDNALWVPLALTKPDNTLSSPSTTTTSANTLLAGPLSSRYFRITVTGITGGPTAGVVEFFSHPNPNVTTVTGQLSLNGIQSMAVWSGTQQTLGTVGVVNNLVTGTLANSGTTTGVGVVTTVTSVTNLASGTLLSSGTTTGVGVVSSVTNLVSGTLLNSGSSTGVGVVSNLTNGSVNILTGTITSITNLANGTVHIDATPGGSTILTTHTLGTGGGTFVGTMVAPVGAGTYIYLTGISMVARSGGTIDVGMATNVAGTTGAGVIARGFFPVGGGVRQEFNPALRVGTNGTLAYFLVSAGTVDLTAQYWVGP